MSRRGHRSGVQFPQVPHAVANRYKNELSTALGLGAVAGLVGIECGVVSGLINLESSGVEASDWRPRHDEHYQQPAADMAGDLFDNWFDPLETEVRARSREFIEELASS